MTSDTQVFNFNLGDKCVCDFHECNHNCVYVSSLALKYTIFMKETHLLQMNICIPRHPLTVIRPSHSWIAVVCSSITQHCFHFAIRVFVCLSMSILFRRDMFSSPRKLPQARSTTPASANNHGCASVSSLVCAAGAGGELHWFIVNRGQQLPVSVSGRYNKWCARSDALYCSSASNLFSCWPRTWGGAALLVCVHV